MNKQNASSLISDAWDTTLENRRLMWYGFFPSLFGILFGIFYIIYQYAAFRFQRGSATLVNNVYIEEISNFIFSDIRSILIFSFLAGAVFIVFIVLPPICQGSLTFLLAKIRRGEKIRIRDGLPYGLTSFLPLIEYHAITSPLSIYTVIFMTLNLVRNFGWENYKNFIGLSILIFLVSFVLSIFFMYADYFIILKKNNPFTAISSSCRTVIFHWEETILISILMFLIGFRVLINIAVAIGIPSLILFIGGLFFVSGMGVFFTIFLSLFVGIIILMMSSWANGVLTIFTTTVWTFAFLNAEEEKRHES